MYVFFILCKKLKTFATNKSFFEKMINNIVSIKYRRNYYARKTEITIFRSQ